jgi:hypothetical protein
MSGLNNFLMRLSFLREYLRAKHTRPNLPSDVSRRSPGEGGSLSEVGRDALIIGRRFSAGYLRY